MTVERIPIAGASFSSAVSIAGPGRVVYVSGKIAEGPDLAAQTELIFDLIAGDLNQMGGSLADVVRITAYLTDLSDYADYSRIRGQRFVENLPASAAVGVASLLHGALIEIDAVAFLPT